MSKVPSPLSYDDYLARVGHHATPEAVDGVRRFLTSKADRERLEEMLEAMHGGEQGYPGLVHVFDTSQIKAVLEHPPFAIQNWHFDRSAGALLVNLRRGVHEFLSAALLHAYRPDRATGNCGVDAERFLDEGLGWFKSSSSLGRVLKGAGIVLTAQEKRAFSSQPFFDA